MLYSAFVDKEVLAQQSTNTLVKHSSKTSTICNAKCTCVMLLLFVTFSRSRIAFSLLYLFPRPGRSLSMARSLFSRSCCRSLCLSFLCRRSRFLSEEVRSSLPITSPLGRSVTTEHNINDILLGNTVQYHRIFNNNAHKLQDVI